MGRKLVSLFAFLGALATSAAPAGAGAGPMAAPAAFSDATVSVPELPFPPNPSMVVSLESIRSVACGRCALAGGELGSEDFFYGELAVDAFDRLTGGQPLSDATRAELFGNLAVSGYHGGRWLKTVVDTLGSDGPADTATTLIGRIAWGLLGAVAAPSPGDAGDRGLIDAASGTILPLVLVYSYNRGYMEVALNSPPAGHEPTGPVLECDGRFDCMSPRFPLAGQDLYVDAFAELAAEPSLLGLLAGLLYGSGIGAGQGVWDGLLGGSGFSIDGYRALLDTSAAFLAVTGTALGAALTAWQDDDPAAAVVALEAMDALVVWAGSYFLGLDARDIDGPIELPVLDCGPSRSN